MFGNISYLKSTHSQSSLPPRNFVFIPHRSGLDTSNPTRISSTLAKQSLPLLKSVVPCTQSSRNLSQPPPSSLVSSKSVAAFLLVSRILVVKGILYGLFRLSAFHLEWGRMKEQTELTTAQTCQTDIKIWRSFQV